MVIKVFANPHFKDTFWTQLTLKAVAAEVTRKRYSSVYIEADSVYDIDFDKEFLGDERRILLYVGHSVSGTPQDIKFLTDNGVHVILINYESSVLAGNCSKVLLNYRDGMQKIVHYLTANNHEKIALFGINPNSATDSLKDTYFAEYLLEKGKLPDDNIYYNYGEISDCMKRFFAHVGDYNSVICANDIVALALVRFLQERGIRVPEDMYVTACGGSTLLSGIAKTTITTVTADQYELGRQAVLAYSHLYKNPCDVALTVKVAAKLTVRASTDFAPIPFEHSSITLSKQVPNFDFYDDPIIQDLFNIEALFASGDELDSGIIEGILKGETYPSIAERLYTSENVISYRIKRMCRISGCSKKNELIALLTPYLC